MARNTSTVYLGYEDEQVTDKNKHLIDYTTNKVGGQPTWPGGDIAVASCPICGLRRPLVLQIYAPLDGSQFHRMLYLFSCVNAVCSNQSRGWLCLRVQYLERNSPVVASEEAAACAGARSAAAALAAAQSIKWCSGADDWGDDCGVDGSDFGAVTPDGGCGGGAMGGSAAEDDGDGNANCEEPNGNVVHNKNDNRVSDDEDDTNSLETDPLPVAAALEQLQLTDDNDRNANAGANVGGGNGAGGGAPIGAVGRLHSPNASAEIEGGEAADELVCIDAPVLPKRDLIALLKQTTAVPMDSGQLQLRGFYVAVEREERTAEGRSAVGGGCDGSAMAEHVRELLLEYQSRDEKLSTSPSSPVASSGCGDAGGGGGGGGESEEKYEKGIPMHGDVMFHNFVSTIQENPGQILRYSRDSLPLLAAPLPDQRPPVTACANCAGPLLCEVQLLPTVIPKLRFAVNGDAAPMEFGNVLVFTCQKSCWDTPDRMRFELVVVQPEM